MNYAVVIPAYNEAATIRDLALRTLRYCPQVVVVDDGSTDGTGELIRDLPVIVLRNGVNQGKAASLWRGAQHALSSGAEMVVTLDGDGQHAPEDIPRLLAAVARHPDCIIIGARLADRHAIPAARYIGNRIANFWISWACGYRLEDSQSGFRLYPGTLFRTLAVPHDKTHGFVFESEVLIEAARHGYGSVAVPIPAVYRLDARASHFRQTDTLRIILMVAWKLLSRGLYLQGLYRAFVRGPRR